MKKPITIFSNFIILLTLLVLIAISVAPALVGFSFHSIISGSMEPEIMTGGLIGLRAIQPEKIRVDDVICFEVEDDRRPICHRVIEIISLNETQYVFQTKGDALATKDNWLVKPEHVLGKVAFDFPFLGYFSSFLKTAWGFSFFVVIPAATIVILELKEYFSPKRPRVRRAQERRKTFLTPANSFVQVGIVITVLIWLTVAGTTQERRLDSFTLNDVQNSEYFRIIKNEGRLPLVICLASSDGAVAFSEAHFWLAPGEEKRVEMHSPNPASLVITRGFLPTLPEGMLFALFSWSIPLSAFAAVFLPMFPILALGWFLLGGVYSVRHDHRERARQMKGRLI